MITYAQVVPHIGKSFIDRMQVDNTPRGTEFLSIPMIDAYGLRPKPFIPETFATRNIGPANFKVQEPGYVSVPTIKSGSMQPTDNTTWKTSNPSTNQQSLVLPNNQTQDQQNNSLLADAETIFAAQNGSEIITITRRNLLLLMLIVVLVVILVAKLLK